MYTHTEQLMELNTEGLGISASVVYTSRALSTHPQAAPTPDPRRLRPAVPGLAHLGKTNTGGIRFPRPTPVQLPRLPEGGGRSHLSAAPRPVGGWASPARARGFAPRPRRPRPSTQRPRPHRPRPSGTGPWPPPPQAARGQGPRDVARSRAGPHHVQQRQRPGSRRRRGAAGRELLGESAGSHLPPHPRGDTEGGADGHAADRLHLREDLFLDQLQRLQLLRSGHHLQLDHDPRLLSGAPLPPLPRAHLYQLAPVGTPALFNRYPAPPHRLHRGSFPELQTERTGGWSDLRFPGHLPLPGERVAVLQDLVRDPVHRRRLTPPGPPSPVGGPAGRVTPRMEGPELATPEETGVSGLAPDPRVGGAGRTLLPASRRVQPLSPAFHTSSENMPPCLGKKSSRQENLISSSSFRTASGTDAPHPPHPHTPPLMVMGEGVLNTPMKPLPLPSPREGRCLKLF